MTTEMEREDGQAHLEAAVADFRLHRAVIEQAKGVLMQLLSIDEEQAFSILSRYSQNHNVKVVDLAARLAEAATQDVTPVKGVREVDELLTRLARLG